MSDEKGIIPIEIKLRNIDRKRLGSLQERTKTALSAQRPFRTQNPRKNSSRKSEMLMGQLFTVP